VSHREKKESLSSFPAQRGAEGGGREDLKRSKRTYCVFSRRTCWRNSRVEKSDSAKNCRRVKAKKSATSIQAKTRDCVRAVWVGQGAGFLTTYT